MTTKLAKTKLNTVRRWLEKSCLGSVELNNKVAYMYDPMLVLRMIRTLEKVSKELKP